MRLTNESMRMIGRQARKPSGWLGKMLYCPLGGGCAIDAGGNVWALTEKGMQAAARKEQHK